LGGRNEKEGGSSGGRDLKRGRPVTTNGWEVIWKETQRVKGLKPRKMGLIDITKGSSSY